MISESQLQYLIQRGNEYCNEQQDQAPRYHEALMCYETALKLALSEQQRQLDKQKHTSATTTTHYSMTGRRQHRPASINKQHSGTDYSKMDRLDECISIILSNKGSVHLKLKELDLACKCFTFSLKIKQDYLYPTHPDVTGMMHNVGICLQNMRRLEEARQVYQECLLLKKQNWVDNARYVPSTLINLGLVEHALGKVITAQKTIKEAVDCGRRLLGSDHAEVANALTHLGKIKLEVGEYNEALRCFNDVIRILQRDFLEGDGGDDEACSYTGPAIEVLNGLVRETLYEMESDVDDDDVDDENSVTSVVSVESGVEADDEYEQLVEAATRRLRVSADDADNHNDATATMDEEDEEVESLQSQTADEQSTLEEEESVPDLKHLLTGPTVYLSASGYDFADTERFVAVEFQKKYPGSIKRTRVGFVVPDRSSMSVNGISRANTNKMIAECVEVVEVELHSRLHYEDLLRFFFQFHDPTVKRNATIGNTSACPSYIFVWDDIQLMPTKRVVKELQEQVDRGRVGSYNGDLVRTAVGHPANFYEAHSQLLRENEAEKSEQSRRHHTFLFKEWPNANKRLPIIRRGTEETEMTTTTADSNSLFSEVHVQENVHTSPVMGYQVVM